MNQSIDPVTLVTNAVELAEPTVRATSRWTVADGVIASRQQIEHVLEDPDEQLRASEPDWPEPSVAEEAYQSALVEMGAIVKRRPVAPDPGKLAQAWLALAGLDGEDTRAIRVLVETFGALGLRQRDETVYELIDRADSDLPDSLLVHLREGPEGMPTMPHVVPRYLGVPRNSPVCYWLAAEPTLSPSCLLYASETLREFRAGALIMRDLVNAYHWIGSGEAPERWYSVLCTPPWGREPQSRAEAADILAETVTDVVAEFFGPRLVATQTPPDGADREFRARITGAHEAPLFAFCCLQLFNAASKDIALKLCKNPKCPRLFHRPTANPDRAGRSDAKYHDQACQEAHKQARYRDLKRNNRSTDNKA